MLKCIFIMLKLGCVRIIILYSIILKYGTYYQIYVDDNHVGLEAARAMPTINATRKIMK